MSDAWRNLAEVSPHPVFGENQAQKAMDATASFLTAKADRTGVAVFKNIKLGKATVSEISVPVGNVKTTELWYRFRVTCEGTSLVDTSDPFRIVSRCGGGGARACLLARTRARVCEAGAKLAP